MNSSISGLEGRRREAAEALLRLLSRAELRELATRLAAEAVSVEAVAARLARLPRFQALGIALSIADPTLRMLRDVLSYLEFHGVAARTTGCALLLADPVQGSEYRVDLSPQEVGAISSWTPKSRKNLRDESFCEALADWRSLSDNWRRLLQKARPYILRGDLDVVETYINARAGHPDPVYEPDRDLTDRSAQDVLRVLMGRVEELAGLLEKLPTTESPTACQVLLREMRDLIRVAQREVLAEETHRRGAGYRSRRQSSACDVPDRRSLLRYVDQRFLDTFDRLAEDLYLLADLLEGDQLLDILGVHIWTSRPQLYEVWLLTSVLSWLEGRGYRIELLKMEQGQEGRSEWRLAYAKDSTPCAQVRGGALKDAAIFYQLYRPSGDMPDLCLIPEPTSTTKPLWAIDAKHSEAGAYSLSAYRATAERYRQSFGADLSLVVEYFPRADLVDPPTNPIQFGTGAVLVTDAAPGRSGLPLALDFLEAIHPPVATAVLCIDLSQSFRSRVNAALYRARANLRSRGATVLDSFVCFADTATTSTGMRAFMGGDVDNLSLLENIAPLGDGTQLLPLINEIRALADGTTIAELLLVSDAVFSDASSAVDTLAAEFGTPVRLWS
jgi:hypothetical protein